MQTDRIKVKENARAALRANYWPIIGWSLLTSLIIGAASGMSVVIIGIAAVVIVVPVVTAGISFFMYRSYLGETADSRELFMGFGNMGHVIGGYWWMMLFTWLWSMLFVIPGIVKAIAYSMTPYILIDQPEVGAKDALRLSMEMTRGHKGEIFVMYLSFLGWSLLSGLTGGILAIFYVGPYMSLTMAGYYDSLKEIYRLERTPDAAYSGYQNV